MANRRDFLKTSAGAVIAAATTRPLFGFQGANNRIRMGVIGMGTRAARVFDSLTRHEDCQFTVGCEVVQNKLQAFQHPEANGRPPRPFAASLPIVGDYRRVLDRNDVDAVLIATPDFSHAKIMVDAVSAGKDVYVEKPVSNSIPRINAMLAAYGAVSGYAFGFLLNLSFWPFSVDPNSSLAYLPGASFTEQWHRYLVFDATTSLGWDTGRAVTNFVAILIVGPAVLTTFRRAARKANFEAPVEFR